MIRHLTVIIIREAEKQEQKQLTENKQNDQMKMAKTVGRSQSVMVRPVHGTHGWTITKRVASGSGGATRAISRAA